MVSVVCSVWFSSGSQTSAMNVVVVAVVAVVVVFAVVVLPRERREKQLIDFQTIGSGCQSLKLDSPQK